MTGKNGAFVVITFVIAAFVGLWRDGRFDRVLHAQAPSPPEKPSRSVFYQPETIGMVAASPDGITRLKLLATPKACLFYAEHANRKGEVVFTPLGLLPKAPSETCE